MPNPRFEPLTLSQEEWQGIGLTLEQRILKLRDECEAQAQAAASLRQRLEEAEAISQGRLRVLNEKADALRSCEIALMNEQAKREQAEAAIEEMQKRIDGVLGSLQHELKTPDDIWAAHIQEQVHQLETVLAELQRRRSPTGQEQG